MEIGSPGGKKERITEEALAALEEEMKRGKIATLEEARRFLDERFGIYYEGVSGLSRLFKRHQTKLKTGRRRSKGASEEEQRAFKK
jgi:transposase